jgi:hypothetical protein
VEKALSQEPSREFEDYENEIEDLHDRLDIAEYDKERLREEVTNLEAKIQALEQEPCDDCRNCKKWDDCECGRKGHINGTSIGYSIGECKDYEPCDDAISRQAVFDLVRSLTRWCVRSEDGKFNNVGLLYDDVMFGIDKLPSVTQKSGTWIALDEGYGPYICSLCEWVEAGKSKYCPNCGARMESEVRNEADN